MIAQYIRKGCVYYNVYNSQGDLALVTSNRLLAELINSSFERNPQTLQVRVRALDPKRLMRT